MPTTALNDEYERALDDYARAVHALVPLLVRLSLASVDEVLPGTHGLEVHGEINEDWIPILRIQRVLDEHGTVLFDIETGHDDPVVEDRIDEVNCEFLDLLLHLTGDDYMGTRTIDSASAELV